MSYTALQSIAKTSEANTVNTSSDTDTTLRSMTSGMYVFENVEAYEAFDEEARDLGLSDDYTITSSDVITYEQSLQPLENLSTYATYFLLVILIIAGIILIVLNMYRVRERKYEIGVLAAIGMNKKKVATQFIIEICITTLLAIFLGTCVGAISAVPLTNALLSKQDTTSDTTSFHKEPGSMKDGGGSMSSVQIGTTTYIEEIRSATDVTVIVQLVGIAMLLTIISGGVAVLTILRFEPLKILSSRD